MFHSGRDTRTVEPMVLLEPAAGGEVLSLVSPATGQPRTTLASLFSGRVVERLEEGETLFWQGDTGQDVFEVVEGALRLVCVLADGRRVVTGFVFAGELAGASSPEQYSNSAEALVSTRIRRCNRSRFSTEIGRNPDLNSQLFRHLRREIATVRGQLVLLACKTAEERVSSFLLSMARRTSGYGTPAGVVHLPMSRPDIADYLGLTRETVSRAMTRLRRQGLIVQMDRYTVAVRQPGNLARLAAEDADIVQGQYLGSTWGGKRCLLPTAPNPVSIGVSMKP
jgi:CRP/FNR family transcriptional regulator